MLNKRPQAQRISKPVGRYRPGKVPFLPGGAPVPDLDGEESYDEEEGSEQEVAEPEPAAHRRIDVHVLPEEGVLKENQQAVKKETQEEDEETSEYGK